MATSEQSSGRIDFLDGVRAVTASYVVAHHIWEIVYPDGNPHGLVGHLTFGLHFGNFGVAVFIVVSGYSLMLGPARNGSRLRDGVPDFIRRRFLRIVLPFWIALAISALIGLTLLREPSGSLWDNAIPVTWPKFLSNLLLLQDVIEVHSINYVFWSIALEWHIYFAFPLLLWAFRRASPPVVASTALLVTSVVGFVFTDGPELLSYFSFFGCFAVGAWAAKASHDIRRGPADSRWGRYATPGAGLLLLASVLIALTTRSYQLADPVLGAAVACALVAMSTGRLRAARRVLASRPLVWLGASSYSLYLLHAPVIHALFVHVFARLGLLTYDPLSLVVLLPVGLVAAILLTRVFYHVAEVPFIPKKKVVAQAP